MTEMVLQENMGRLGIEFAKFAEPSAGSLGFGVAAGNACPWATDL